MNAPSFCSSISTACCVTAMSCPLSCWTVPDSKLRGRARLHIRAPHLDLSGVGHARWMVLGRELGRAAIERLLADARVGTSGVLVVSGEPGIGKSALLAYAHAAAGAGGMRVLSARGIEREAAIPFGGLLELLRPVLGHIEQLPAP